MVRGHTLPYQYPKPEELLGSIQLHMFGPGAFMHPNEGMMCLLKRFVNRHE